MNKICLFILLLFCLCGNAFAQQDLSGRVVDKNVKPLPFTTVVLLHPTDSTIKFFGVTNDKGVYQLRRVKEGDYLMQFSFTGFKSVYNRVTIPLKSNQLGDQILVENPTELDQVIVEAELIPIKFKTDTLEYDAKAFKTRAGASVEELLEKLPGVEVDKEGNVKAQGEEVVKVLVDGKEFFGNDPKVATKNLPADAISKVQVLDRKSDEAAFTGIEDGERDRTINLLLKEDHKKGYFGEIKAGIGTDKSHLVEAKVYRFSNRLQVAALGLQNNINQFGFTQKGNSTFGESIKGINESLAGGLNLSLNKSNGDRYFASYLGNRVDKDLNQQSISENFLEAGAYTQASNLLETERDRPHDINFGVRSSIGKNAKFILNGNATIGTNRSFSETISNATFNNLPVNNFSNNTLNESDQLAVNTSGSYAVKLKGNEFQMSTRFALNYSENESVLDWTNVTTIFDPMNTNTIHQLRNNNTDQFSLLVAPTFTRKLSDYWAMDFGLGLLLKKNQLNRVEGIFNDQGDLDGTLIPAFTVNETVARPTLGIRRANTKVLFSLNLNAYSSQFDRNLANAAENSTRYFYLMPQLVYRNAYRSGRRVEARYSTNVIMPNQNQLFPITNTLNQVSVYEGNINLKPEYRHNLRLTWSVFDEFSFTSFFITAQGSYVENKINNAQVIDDQLIQTISPINTDGQTSLTLNADFSTPIRSIGLNFTTSLVENFTQGITLINMEENETSTFNHNLTFSFENRNKDKMRISVGSTLNYTQSSFSIAQLPNNDFFNISYFANLRLTPVKRFNFTSQATITNYNSQSFNESVTIPLITASASYGFLQAEKATITISAFDILNKYIGFSRISTANYLSQSEWNTIGQYFMLTLGYRFR